MAGVYSFEEVSKHSIESDLWVVMNNKVYNVTEFVEDHAGGEEVFFILLDEAGKDVTESLEDIGHSDEACEILAKYQIGELNVALRREYRRPIPIHAREPPPQMCSGCPWKVLISALIVASAMTYKLFKQKH